MVLDLSTEFLFWSLGDILYGIVSLKRLGWIRFPIFIRFPFTHLLYPPPLHNAQIQQIKRTLKYADKQD